MDLESFTKKYPGIRLANHTDNKTILEFFDHASLTGRSITMRYERSPDFFKLLRCRSEVFYCLLAFNDKGQLKAVGTLSLREGFVNGKRSTICYLGDLRVDFDRKLGKVWRDFYGDLISHSKQISELSDVGMFLTAIIDENEMAQKSLVREKKRRFSYEPLTSYKMVNIFAPNPLSPKRSHDYKYGVSPIENYELSAVTDFLNNESSFEAGGYDYKLELKRRLEVWPGFSNSDILAVRDPNNKILGSCGLWTPTSAKRIIIEKLAPMTKLLTSSLSLFNSRIPREGQELKVIYLTHLRIARNLPADERAQIFCTLIDRILKSPQMKGYSFLAYCDFACDSFASSLGNYIKQEVPMKLFEVQSGGSQTVPSRRCLSIPGVGFEMSLV